eukprot:jgi/Mesvir1/23286/Mv20988-RA.1
MDDAGDADPCQGAGASWGGPEGKEEGEGEAGGEVEECEGDMAGEGGAVGPCAGGEEGEAGQPGVAPIALGIAISLVGYLVSEPHEARAEPSGRQSVGGGGAVGAGRENAGVPRVGGCQ